MKFYYSNGSISGAAAITLIETGIEFEPVRIDFATGEQTKPAYHAINPKGRVPAIADAGEILTEVGAILHFLAAKAPAAKLIPEDPWQAGKMREWMFYFASTMHVAHAHKLRGARWATEQASLDDMTANVARTMNDCSAFVESRLQTEYLIGDRLSLADLYLYPISCWLAGDGVTLADYPKFSAWKEMMDSRNCVIEAKKAGIF